MNYRTIKLVVVVWGIWTADALHAQVTRDCGDVTTAAEKIDHFKLYFTGSGSWDTLRAGQWPKLPTGSPASVVTKRDDCNKIVDAVNTEIEETFPPSSVFRTLPLKHWIYGIGDYYTVYFGPMESVGWNPLWILNRQSLVILWKTSA